MDPTESEEFKYGAREFYRGRATEMLRLAAVAQTEHAKAELITLADRWARLAQNTEQF
jgi:hypothetical protein